MMALMTVETPLEFKIMRTQGIIEQLCSSVQQGSVF